MTDLKSKRRQMVDGQLRTYDVFNLAVIDAFDAVERENFIPQSQQPLAYCDKPLPLGYEGRTLLTPMVLARLIQAFEIPAFDKSSLVQSEKPLKILNIAGGLGYGAAILARLGAHVALLEESEALVKTAQDNITRAKLNDAVSVHCGILTHGVAQHAPFDAILIEGVFEILPEQLVAQLKEGGTLIGLQGTHAATKAMIYQKIAGQMSGRVLISAHGCQLKAFARTEDFAF